MRGEIDRDHVEHKLGFGRIKAVAAAREISQRGAGVDALIPSGERIAQRAFYHRRAHDRDVERVATREHQLLAKTLRVTVRVGPSPTLRALATDVLQALLEPLLAPMLDRRLAWIAVIVFVTAKLRMTHLIARLGLHPLDRRQRIANFALEPKRLAPVGAPVFRDFVFIAVSVGDSRDVAGGHMHHRGADFAAELDHVGDASSVYLDRLFQRRLEIYQPRAMHDCVQAARLERLRFFGEQTLGGNVAGNDDDLFFDVVIELGAEMFAQRRKHRRVENLAAKPAEAAAPVAAYQQIDALDLRMPSQQDREEHLAEKSGRASQQDAAALEHLLERRHRCPVAFAVATRHPRSPAAAGADRLSRRSDRDLRSPSRSPRRACPPLPNQDAPRLPALRIPPRSRARRAGARARPSTTCRTDARRGTRCRSGTCGCRWGCARIRARNFSRARPRRSSPPGIDGRTRCNSDDARDETRRAADDR